MSENRESVGDEPTLLQDPIEIAKQEAANAIRQFDAVLDLIDEVARDKRVFRLRPSTILSLHRIAMDGLTHFAGTWRPSGVSISASAHKPPHESRVASLIEEMCEYVNDRWDELSALDLCAYTMWRINWIHPFLDGNGRTSRAISYLVLCAKLGDRLPGRLTIPEQIASHKRPYYAALEAADAGVAEAPDLGPMTDLLRTCLGKQLTSTFEQAGAASSNRDTERKLH